TQQLLYRVRSGEFSGLDPETVVLLIGTNNLNRNSAAEVADAISLVIHEFRKIWVDVHFVVVAIPPRELPRSRKVLEKADQANRLVAAQCDGNRGVTFVDDEDRFLGSDGWINRTLYTGEGVHLTVEGYEVLAQLIRPAIDRSLNRDIVTAVGDSTPGH